MAPLPGHLECRDWIAAVDREIQGRSNVALVWFARSDHCFQQNEILLNHFTSTHPNKPMRTIPLLILFSVPFLAHADAYKCKEVGGRVVFSASPCPDNSVQIKSAQSANISGIQYQRAQSDLERQRAWLRGREAEQRVESRSAPVSVVQDNYGNTEKIHACLMAVTATSGLSPYSAGSRRVSCFAGTKGRVDECESSVAATPLLTITQESSLKARCRSL